MKAHTHTLLGKVVLVTGAASGIGAAGAAELQRRGAVPVLVDQDVTGLAAQAETLAGADGTRPLAVQADITSLAECEAAVQATLAHWQGALVRIGFLDPAAPKKLLPRLNQLLNRAQPTADELHLLRGIARAVEAAADGLPRPADGRPKQG